MRTVRFASSIYGDGPAADDPAEAYHEASSIYEATAGRELAGARRLHAQPGLRRSAARSTNRRTELEPVALPEAAPLRGPLGRALRLRRTRRELDPVASLTLLETATLLDAGYGVTGAVPDDEQQLRCVPSAGALYPLDLYLSAQRVTGLTVGRYHFDPLRRNLARCGPAPDSLAVGTCISATDGTAAAPLVLVLTATFWRSRFKYGLRGYRFCLLEAGHVCQNILLAAAALGLQAVPYGGFLDRRLNSLWDLDGVDEAALYVICVGR